MLLAKAGDLLFEGLDLLVRPQPGNQSTRDVGLGELQRKVHTHVLFPHVADQAQCEDPATPIAAHLEQFVASGEGLQTARVDVVDFHLVEAQLVEQQDGKGEGLKQLLECLFDVAFLRDEVRFTSVVFG